MCGICGTISLGPDRPDPAPTRAMLDALVHRGPDSGGVFADRRVAAGVRRLRVIDLETGDQPIANEDGTVEVVFNGEIYNYQELREELLQRGHRFRTRSDTEVLVHLWEDDGPAMLPRLLGMFGFCLRDRRRDEVFVARDRLGVKPLYYRVAEDRLQFASEVGALVRRGGQAAEIDEARLIDLFCLQYVPGEATLYRGVRKLLPGHYLRVRAGALEVGRWYEIPDGPPEGSGGMDLDRARRELPPLLASAVRYRTVADVPLGMFLSGGIDSSVVLHLLAEATGEAVRTFSVGFEGEDGEGELGWARLVAGRHRTVHHEMKVSPADVERHLPALIDHLAEPVVDPATLPTWLLSRLARGEVTVVLTGEGADELFGGYRRYLFQSRYGRVGRVPGLRRAAQLPWVERWLPSRAGQALEALAEIEPARNHLLWSATVDPATARSLFEPEGVAAFESRTLEHFARYFPRDEIGTAAVLRADLHEWLPHDLLSKVDRASMAFSLEARVPYLDHRVVEWAASLPDDLKIRGRETKRVLRESFREAVPREILERPKRGFDLPLGAWLRGPLRDLARAVVTPRNLEMWPAIRPAAARQMLDQHLEGRRDYGLPLFNLVSVLLFLERRPRP